jgi:hypothetical protein
MPIDLPQPAHAISKIFIRYIHPFGLESMFSEGKSIPQPAHAISKIFMHLCAAKGGPILAVLQAHFVGALQHGT